jgi:cysteine desulfurase
VLLPQAESEAARPFGEPVTVYLDWNATSPRHPEVVRAMELAESEAWANPSSVHHSGRAARRHVEDARETLAKVLKVHPRDVVFTGGGTEANHLALSGARSVVTTRIEHPSIVKEAESLQAKGCQVVFAPVTPGGWVSPEAIDAALAVVTRDAPAEKPPECSNRFIPLVAVSGANHETGVLQPIREIAEVVHSRGARLHVDAVQLLGRGKLSHIEGFDSASVASHKLRGPKGVGALVHECGFLLTPLGRGGAQEKGLRPGTIDATALAGFRAALLRVEQSEVAYRAAADLGDELRRTLVQLGGGKITLHGSDVPALGHVVNFRVAGWRGDELVAALDLEGICVSSGSACSAGTAEPSAVILAMLGAEAARGAVRVSFGESSSARDLEALVGALTRLGALSPS